MKIIACIPARYESSRLPGKPLLKINNKTIIQHVYENVKKVVSIDSAIVLTDDKRIYDEVIKFGGECEIITEECLNGTDRIIWYLKKHFNSSNEDLVIANIQGDEPFINSDNIQKAIDNYISRKKLDTKMVCSTLYYKTNKRENVETHSKGKAVLDKDGNIIYCSRNIIPSGKKDNFIEGYMYNIHIGIFIFDKDYLLNYYQGTNTPLQLAEDIEWLKIIEQGYRINAIEITEHEIGVDTENDFLYLKKKYEKNSSN